MAWRAAWAVLLFGCGSSVVDPPGEGGGASSSSATSVTPSSSSIADGGHDGGGGDTAAPGAGGADAGGSGGAPSGGALGMNDVSILVPLPRAGADAWILASHGAASGEPMLPRGLYERVIDVPGSPGAILDDYDALQIVAVRFDLCDRAAPGPCPEIEDARLRVVFQPVFEGAASDSGIHVFYAIPRERIEDALADLDALHDLRGTSTSEPLSINASVATDEIYRARLRAFVEEHAEPDALVRITAMAQVSTAAALRWVFTGLEEQDGELAPIVIPGADALASEVLLLADASYQLTPPADSPAGALVGFSGPDFANADDASQGAALRALVDIDNPHTHVANTVQCAACHLSTVTLPRRAAAAGVDPLSIPGRYVSDYDLSVAAGDSADDDGLVRAFGYRGTTVAITQRVVNETAQVLEEIRARYP